MPTFDPTTGSCEIRTFKAGLLSAVGHDLAFRVQRWSLTLDPEEERIEGTFDGTSLEVLGAVKDGVVDPGVLSAKEQAEVLENIRKYVFKGFRPAEIAFEAEDVEFDEDAIEGEGTLLIPPGRHAVQFEASVEDGSALCKVRLHQPDFGIVPFKALMGALKIQPDIEVWVTVPFDG